MRNSSLQSFLTCKFIGQSLLSKLPSIFLSIISASSWSVCSSTSCMISSCRPTKLSNNQSIIYKNIKIWTYCLAFNLYSNFPHYIYRIADINKNFYLLFIIFSKIESLISDNDVQLVHQPQYGIVAFVEYSGCNAGW